MDKEWKKQKIKMDLNLCLPRNLQKIEKYKISSRQLGYTGISVEGSKMFSKGQEGPYSL